MLPIQNHNSDCLKKCQGYNLNIILYVTYKV